MALSNGWRGTKAPRLTAAGEDRCSYMHARTVISGYVATVATMPAGNWTVGSTISHAQDRERAGTAGISRLFPKDERTSDGAADAFDHSVRRHGATS